MFIKAASTVLIVAPALVASLPLLSSNNHGDLKVFADAFVKASTGGALGTCDKIGSVLGLNLNLGLGLTLSSVTSFTSKLTSWAEGQCWNSYHDVSLCGEISAFLAITAYARERGWNGRELLASLGVGRVNHWHDLLNGLCHTPGYPVDTCGALSGQWDGWYTSYTSLSHSAYAAQALELNKFGLYTLVDAAISANVHTSASTSSHADGRGLPAVDANVAGTVHGDLHSALQLDNFHADTDATAKLDILGKDLAHRGLPSVDALIAGAAHADLTSAIGLDGHKTFADATGNLNVLGHANLHRSLDATAAGSFAAKVAGGVKVGHLNSAAVADANLDAFAHANVHRGLDAVAAGSVDGKIAGDVKLGHNFLSASTNSRVDASGHVAVHRSLPGLGAAAFLEGQTKIVHLTGTEGSALALFDDKGVISSGQGKANVVGVKLEGQGSAVIY